eukprot:TRINITY_DN5796_c0_g1_i1.p1 TRINITY_DN5796_c0_g1~~TRINITY_DN5796_c0_g1_i1.p1  ORF type:complete len:177 (-),score=53.58 TRINITY_DN5796_c0_g1_i1:4-534(-)
MRENLKIIIKGKTVYLVPYRKEHVLKYHDWMEDPEILEMTCSERLTLEEEYEMQQTWSVDENKCTFILLDTTRLNTETNIYEMCGDVNLFFHEYENEGENKREVAEIEIMIAEKESRRKGIAFEALFLMMYYAVEHLNTKKFVAKINFDNSGSISLFKKLGYEEVSGSEVLEKIKF